MESTDLTIRRKDGMLTVIPRERIISVCFEGDKDAGLMRVEYEQVAGQEPMVMTHPLPGLEWAAWMTTRSAGGGEMFWLWKPDGTAMQMAAFAQGRTAGPIQVEKPAVEERDHMTLVGLAKDEKAAGQEKAEPGAPEAAVNPVG